MTLWNHLNVLSDPRRPSGDKPSASFDPSRTGDPLGPSRGEPAIGIGDARADGATLAGDPRRHPIGFAPAEERAAERHFRTEISFKRHHELPRASATPEQPEDASQPSWPIPADAAERFEESTPEQLDAPHVDADGPAAGEDVVPFYKREISFRRKRALPDETPAPVVVPEDGADATEAEAGDDPEAAEVVEVAEVAEVAEVIEEQAADDAAELVASGDGLDQAAHEVAPEPVVEDPSAQAEESDLEPEPAAEVVAPVDASTTEANASDPDTSDPDASDPDQAAAVLPELVEVVEPEAKSEEPELVDDSDTTTPVAAAEEALEADAPSGQADPAVEEAPAPAGRSSRKERNAEKKAAKRTPAHPKGQAVGLKIGASQIAAAVVSETGAGHELVGLARRPLDAGIVVDGEVRDEAALANALKALFDEEKLPRKDVRIGLASNRIGVRTFDIVGVDDEAKFDNAVRFKAHEVLPVAWHQSVLDYRVLDQRPNEDGEQMRRVLLVVAPRDQVDPYQRVADSVGLKLAGIDLEALGLLRAFVDPKPLAAPAADDTATVVVAIGHESSTLLVAGGGACEFTRVFDWGGGVLEEAIAAALEVLPAEAATILRHVSLSGPGRQYDTLDDAARAKAIEAIRLRLTPFARELVNSLQFYQTQAESLGIGGIVITGGTSHLEGLGEVLHQMIGVNVSIGDPLARVIRAGEFDPAIEAVMGSMAVPIGLAISDESTRGVNLLGKDGVKKTSRRSAMIAIGAPVAVAVPLLALGMLYVGAHGKVADRQTELDAVKAQIAVLPQPHVAVIDAGVVGDEAVRATAVASVLGGRLAWDAVFRDMARVLPENVWLSSLSLSQPQATNLADATTKAPSPLPGSAEAAPSAVAIEGFTYTQPDVARLLARLATLPSLARVTLTSSQRELVGKSEVVHFAIVADLNQTGGAS